MMDERTLRLLLGVGATAAVASGVRRHHAVRAVPPELRAGWLYLPTVVPPVLPWRAANLAAARVARRLLRRSTHVCSGVVVDRHDLRSASGEEIALYLYEPPYRRTPSGSLLWIHGGALVAGHPAQDHDLCSMIAADLEILVVSVDYRLAPDHRFPTAHDDCFSVLTWMHRESHRLGIDRNRVAVGGSSAGGGLAATVAQRSQDENVPVAAQVLVYPMLDDRSAMHDHGGRGRLSFTTAMNRYSWTSYLGHRPTPADPGLYASAARRPDLRGLPPAWLGVGDLDLLHDDAVAYADRLREAGVPTELHVEPGMYHGADVGLASSVPSMHAFRERVVAAIAAAVAAPR